MDEENTIVQVKDNSPQIEHTLRPIMFVSWFLSVGVAHPRKYPKIVTIILHIIHFGICSIIVAYGVIDFFNAFDKVFKSNIFKIMYCMNKVTCYVTTYYYVYHSIKQYNKWPELIEKIENLDQIIKKKMKSSVNDRLIKNIEVLAILATFVCGPLFLIIHIVYYYFTRPEHIYASDLLLYYTIAQSLINSFAFDIIVYVLYHRCRMINELILQLNNKQFSPSWITLKIRCIRELHAGICDLVITVNEVYGFHLLLCSTNCFTMVVATLFRIYMDFVEQNYEFMLINNILWILYALQFSLICWFCTLMRQESDKTRIIIYTIMFANCKDVNKLNNTRNQSCLEVPPENQDCEQNSNRSSSYNSNDNINNLLKNLDQYCLRNEINDFSIQLQQHQVAITACNFFKINNALLKSFIAAIITYLAILIQFYQPKHLNANYNSTRAAE